tara:strand:- start:3040 stop:3684 length:645 start_codon:yes stop_codon:yes gene_type:complete
MESFHPVDYSLEENQFFLDHLGESPVAALQDKTPGGVNPVAVQEVLGEVYELDELEKHRGIPWAGKDAVQEIITRYLFEYKKWREMSKRGAPRFPTMHAWDSKGRPHKGGISSDSSKVTTYIDDNGNRQPLAVSFRDVLPTAFKAPWIPSEEPIPDQLVEDMDKGVIQCPIDGWAANFKPESRQSYNMARARMARHCKSSKNERVQEFAMKVFG